MSGCDGGGDGGGDGGFRRIAPVGRRPLRPRDARTPTALSAPPGAPFWTQFLSGYKPLVLVVALNLIPLVALMAGRVEIQQRDGAFVAHLSLLVAFVAVLFISPKEGFGFRAALLIFVAAVVVLTFAALYGLFPVGADEGVHVVDGRACDGAHPPGGCETRLVAWRDRVYFSMVTFTTLGYGDFSPFVATRIVAATEAVCGMIFVGLFLGIVVPPMIGPYTRRPRRIPSSEEKRDAEDGPDRGGDPGDRLDGHGRLEHGSPPFHRVFTWRQTIRISRIIGPRRRQ